MGRYRGSVCRLCRRENLKMFLKGDRCYSDKCSFERKAYPPGDHSRVPRKVSDYGIQLREKQKVKRMYGLMEKQFRGYFKRAERQKGITGENLLMLLERRLDNTIFRLGFARSRNEARQVVKHSHFLVNGKKVNIPSYIIKPADVIELKEKSRKINGILESLNTVSRRGVPNWLELDKDQFKGRILSFPTREDLTFPIEEKLIVELYSK